MLLRKKEEMDNHISLSDNPGDYKTPYTSWYPNQHDVAEKIVNLPEGKVLLLEMPTGAGKSLLPIVTSHFRKGTVVMMSTRDLQLQYEQSFSNAAVIWGQSHYPCVDEINIDKCRAVYNEAPSRDDCPFDSYSEAKDGCDLFYQCPYEIAKRKAFSADCRVLNYHYGYFSSWWKDTDKANLNWDLFCDEAHRLPDVLSGLVSIRIAPSTAKHFHLPSFPQISGGLRRDMEAAATWLRSARNEVSPMLKVKDVRARRSAMQFYTKLDELQDAIHEADRESWHIQSDKDGFAARPVIPGDYAHKIVIPNARSVILMSATIGHPEILLADLGLSTSDYEFFSVPHGFPPDNRPVFWVTNVPKIRYKTTPAEYAYQADVIGKILDMHNGEKGLIHTASWKHTNELAERLSGNGNADRIMVADGARLETVEKFKQSPLGTVAISPSWQEGLNFPDDELRFSVIGKTPWLSQGDPVVRMRMRRKGGGEWYKSKAALRVVQAAGRGVRHKNDWCVTYICDGTWGQVEPYVPQWFMVDRIRIGG